jgi:hypothetical protein
MKTLLRLSLFVALMSTMLISCEEDTLPGENYQNQFLGTWNAAEKTGYNSPQNYTVEISRGSNQDEIIIRGLYNNTDVMVSAELFGLEIEIPFQTSDSISFTGSGQASIDFDQVSIDFIANDGSGDDRVKVILTR